MNVGIIDADLLDNGTRHPNLALLKISGYLKANGHQVKLLFDYESIDEYDQVYIGKVFTFTKLPEEVIEKPNVICGGTGFLPVEYPDLLDEIEHHMPDYTLYDEFVNREIERGIKPLRFTDYKDYSIGFATRGCFRKCSFCVNKKYDKVKFNAHVSEFFDETRKYIYLWDDNILGYDKWKDVFKELADTGRHFQFRQGLDLRLMTEEKAAIISKSRWIGDFIFAFDYLKDRELIEQKLRIWKRHSAKTTKLYVLCAYESQDVNDIISVFERISVLMRYRCLPYIMRYDEYKNSEFVGLYINLARWCNQPNFFKKKSFREYCEANGENSSTFRYMLDFEKKYPEVARKYFDLKYEKMPIAFEQPTFITDAICKA